MTTSHDLSLCECRSEFDHPHRGRTRFYRFDINVQPPGHGSFTAPTKLRLCEAHAPLFLDGYVRAWTSK